MKAEILRLHADGYTIRGISCVTGMSRCNIYKILNPEKEKEYVDKQKRRKRTDEYRAKNAVYTKLRRSNDPKIDIRRRLGQIKVLAKKNYQLEPVIGVHDVLLAYARQNCRCAICGIPEKECDKALRIDHDHRTGKFRGLLCGPCNMALGNAKDSPNILREAADYIERSFVNVV